MGPLGFWGFLSSFPLCLVGKSALDWWIDGQVGGLVGELVGGPSVSCRCPLSTSRVYASVSRGLIPISGASRVPPGSGMTTKIIHFMVNGRLEHAEFGADCSAADVKGKRPGARGSPQLMVL